MGTRQAATVVYNDTVELQISGIKEYTVTDIRRVLAEPLVRNTSVTAADDLT